MEKNNWKSFLIKALVFVTVTVCADFLVGKAFRLLENKALDHSPYGMVTEYTMWKVDANVIIMGASEAQHSYIPSYLEEQLGMTVYNCGKDGCRFYYQNAMINGILDRYNPKMIIWSISPNFLCKPSEEDKGNLSQLNPFYGENAFCKQALKTKSEYEPIKLLSKNYSYNSRLFPFLYKMFMPDYQYEYGGYAPLYGNQKNLRVETREWTEIFDESLVDVFKETIQRCIRNNVQIVFVFTPRLEKGDYKQLEAYNNLIHLLKNYQVIFIEELYHNDELMHVDFFKDNAHLNNDGAYFFNKKLVDYLSSDSTVLE